MENFLRPIYQEHASDSNTLGILIIEATQFDRPITDGFDTILLIIVQKQTKDWFVKHYEVEGKTAAIHVIKEQILMNWIDTSGYRRAVEWIIHGRTIYDRNEYVKNLKEELRFFPEEKRNMRKMIDFGKLVKSYSEAKLLYEAGENGDAYSKILNSLHYLARLSVIDQGYYPEVTVWGQVKNIDLEVYKLYETLLDSTEGIDKRIELMLIAMDFVINNRAKSASRHLLELMKEKEGSWSYTEIKAIKDVQHYTYDLSVILSYLIEKDIIEVVLLNTKNPEVFQRTYKVKDTR